MSSFEITKYDAEMQMSLDTAERLSELFVSNYPASHSDAERIEDTETKTGEAIRELVVQGRDFYVASANDTTVAGFIESKTVDVPDGTYEHLVWIMTANEYRGHQLASLLHRSFIVDATLRALERAPKPTSALLSVHEQNPARTIYEHWGYSVTGTTDTGKFFMAMRLPIRN